MMYAVLIVVGFVAGLLSGSVGFGGGMILLPVITWCFGVEVAIPVSTIAQMLSNINRASLGWREIQWKHVGWFLLLAAPLTAAGAYSFTVVDKVIATRALCVFLVIFAIMKFTGKLRLPESRATTLIGGGVTGFINGLLGISGPLSSAVFFSLGLTPVAYVASEAAAAAAMHVVKAVVYSKFALMDWHIFLSGLGIGLAMMAGNYIAMRFVRTVNKELYKKLVAGVMIACSVFLFCTVH